MYGNPPEQPTNNEVEQTPDKSSDLGESMVDESNQNSQPRIENTSANESMTSKPEQKQEQPTPNHIITNVDGKYLKAFVGDKFADFARGGFNIGAFFFGVFYLFYRKMYLYGFILFLISPFIVKLLGLLASIVVSVAMGLLTNKLYLTFAESKVRELSSMYKGDELLKKCKEKGGTSNIGIIIGIVLLLFIPILGIFMIVGIPATQRTINNSRKDTFLDTAKKYANAVKNAWASDEINCGGTNAQSLSEGYYYIYFKTGGEIEGVTDTNAESNAKNLISTELKSPWGNANIGGYVKVEVPQNNVSMTRYKIFVVDEKEHGIIEEEISDNLTRAHVRDLAILPEPSPYSYTQSSIVTCKVESTY